MRTREIAATMIHNWAEAGWPVRCAVTSRVAPLGYRTSGMIVEREETVVILAGDGCTSRLPPELLSADRVDRAASPADVYSFRFRFPQSDILLGDAETGGSHATH